MLTRKITGSIILLLLFLGACTTESDIDSTVATFVAATVEAAGSTDVTSPTSNSTATLEESTVTQPTKTPEPTTAVERTLTAELPSTPRLVWSLIADRVVVLVDVEKAIIQSNEAIQAVDINNGEVLWSVTGSSPLLGADSDLVYTLPFSQRVDALDTDTGEPVWSSQLPVQVQTSSRSVYYSSHWMLLLGFNPQIIIDKTNGQGFSIQGQGLLQFEGDSLLLDGPDKAYRFPSMEVIWEVDGIERCGDLVLYTKDQEEQLVAALDIQSGEELWQAQYPGNVYKASCPVNANVLIYDFSTLSSVLTTPILARPDPEQGSQNIYIEVSDYFSYSNVYAIDGQTGTPQFINENTLLYLTGDTPRSLRSNFRWAGGFRGLDIYYQPDFGMTRAHRMDNNELMWTSNQYALNTVLGGWDDVLVGFSGTIQDSIFAGVDKVTGELKWQREVEALTPYGFVGDYFVFNDEDNILILDPRTGQVESSIPLPFRSRIDRPVPIAYGENYFIVWSVTSGVGLVELP